MNDEPVFIESERNLTEEAIRLDPSINTSKLKRYVRFLAFPIDFFNIIVYNDKYNKTKKKENNMNTGTSKPKTFKKVDFKSVGRGIISLGLMISVASMFYATVIVWYGTESELLPKIWVAPMALYALSILTKVFLTSNK